MEAVVPTNGVELGRIDESGRVVPVETTLVAAALKEGVTDTLGPAEVGRGLVEGATIVVSRSLLVRVLGLDTVEVFRPNVVPAKVVWRGAIVVDADSLEKVLALSVEVVDKSVVSETDGGAPVLNRLTVVASAVEISVRVVWRPDVALVVSDNVVSIAVPCCEVTLLDALVSGSVNPVVTSGGEGNEVTLA